MFRQVPNQPLQQTLAVMLISESSVPLSAAAAAELTSEVICQWEKGLEESKLFTKIFADGAAASDEALEVALFVIEFAVVPGAGEDFDPFISEHADDGVEGFAVGLVIAHEGTGPREWFQLSADHS